MFNMDSQKIQNMTNNRTTYLKGVDYYNKGKIEIIHFDEKNMNFQLIAYGSYIYDLTVQFSKRLSLQGLSCTCPASNNYDGLCKHGVAALLTIIKEDDLGNYSDLTTLETKNIKEIQAIKNNKSEDIRFILESFKEQEKTEKTEVNLEINYELSLEEYSDTHVSAFNFRIGDGKLYVIKNLKEFITSLNSKRDVPFGKEFTFYHEKYKFKAEDIYIIDFLKEMYDIEESSYSKSYYSYGRYGSRNKIFKDKRIILNPQSLKRFFSLLWNRSFNVSIYGDIKAQDVKILEEDIPIDLNISKKEDDLILGIGLDDSLMRLYSEGQYFFYRNNIYKISEEQNKNLTPFLYHMATTGKDYIDIPKEYSSKFITEVMPQIERTSNISIDEKVEKDIYKPVLKSEIYMDRSGDVITLELLFRYDDITIKPFIDKVENKPKDNRILIRDKEKENTIMKIIEESLFKVSKDNIYIEDEEDMFDFMVEKLPMLQEVSEIYYSSGFKAMEIKDSSSFSGSLRLDADSSMLEFSFDIEGVSHQELPNIFKSLKEKKKYYKLKDGSFLPLSHHQLNEVQDIMDSLNIDQQELINGIIQIPKFRAMYLDDEITNSDLRFFKRNVDFKQLVQNIKEPDDIEYNVPDELKGVLRSYQETGLKWFKTLVSYGFGGILADDMGLGKTLQTIAFLLSEKIEKGVEPSIIVAPTSLVYNWESEIKKFANSLNVLVISGSKLEREEKIVDVNDYDVIITSYPLIRRDIDSYSEINFRNCILDEAQYIKNAGSQNAISVKSIVAKNRFALTGTPIENSLTELWSIFDFIMPSYLLSRSKFAKQFEKPIVKDADDKTLDKLGKHIRPFILRRLKKDVLKELPDKIENTMVAELTTDQKKVYLAYLENIKNEIDQEIKTNGFGKSHLKILAGLTRLRQICCDPSMFIENYKGKSGKLMMLEEIVNDFVDSGHRILIFSQFTTMLKIISEMLEKNGIEFMSLDGSTPMEKRGMMVDDFNKGQGKVFLISLKAGGTGLNLTGADTVIHYDPWWNPAVEEQATDRAHRIGQENIVHVMKLICKGTIEEKILELQEKKKRLIDSVIKPGETLVSKLSEEDLKSIFDTNLV